MLLSDMNFNLAEAIEARHQFLIDIDNELEKSNIIINKFSTQNTMIVINYQTIIFSCAIALFLG